MHCLWRNREHTRFVIRHSCQLLRVRPFVSIEKGSDEELMAPAKNRHKVDTEAFKDQEQQIIQLTEKVIKSVTSGDFQTYRKLVDPQVTAFEPVSRGQLVEGLQFHKFYFDTVLGKKATPINRTILSPRVHMLGDDAACICYVRLQQFINSAGVPLTRQTEETRVWQKKSGQWVNVHLHLSNMTNSPSN